MPSSRCCSLRASTSRASANCGTSCQARVIRSTMRCHTEPAASAGDVSALSTSAASTAPPGPLPATAATSTPRALASRRAFGEASPRRGFGAGAPGMAAFVIVAGISVATTGTDLGSSVNCSPSASTSAITEPTGTSAPSGTAKPARVPSAGASISTVTLSVSTSSSGSPFATCAPSSLSQRRTLPVSCAIPSAGMITSAGMRALEPGGVDDGVGDPRVVEVRGHLPLARERSANRVLPAGRDQKLLGREARDHLGAGGCDHELLLDREPDPVAVLERECCLLVRETELLGAREDLDHLGGRDPRADHGDRLVEDVAAALVRIDQRPGRR